jgi:hypothetical protein
MMKKYGEIAGIYFKTSSFGQAKWLSIEETRVAIN